MKKCPRCEKEFPKTNEFFFSCKSRKDGFDWCCKICKKNIFKERMKTEDGRNLRKKHLWKNLGFKKNDGTAFTVLDYNEILKKQENKCKICGTDNCGKRGWHVDHDHKTGLVRGILCLKCNSLLGMSNDNVEILYLAIQYLNEHSGQTSVISVK